MLTPCSPHAAIAAGDVFAVRRVRGTPCGGGDAGDNGVDNSDVDDSDNCVDGSDDGSERQLLVHDVKLWPLAHSSSGNSSCISF